MQEYSKAFNAGLRNQMRYGSWNLENGNINITIRDNLGNKKTMIYPVEYEIITLPYYVVK